MLTGVALAVAIAPGWGNSMALRWFIRPNAYYDSVKLMRVSESLQAAPGVLRAAAVMATPLNIDLLADDGLLPPNVEAGPDDLLVSVIGKDDESAETALGMVDEILTVHVADDGRADVPPPRTLESAAGAGHATLAVVAVPGPSATVEALAALRSGLHVFLFSDNVPLEDEVRLKELAAARDVLMMGPDCGTAILRGVGLGFANRVQRGPVGIVGASGTGIQQLCCLLDAAGVGIAEAIGTGGRDLSASVGGSMTRRALRLLDDDGDIEIIAVISKPAGADAVQSLHDDLVKLHKPAVVCLLGSSLPDTENVRYAATLTDAAEIICTHLGVDMPPYTETPAPRKRRGRGNRVYGLYTGGTLCSEAEGILDGLDVQHQLVDLGADEFTRGRAHPMIDPRLRNSMMTELAERDDLGVVLFDVVLGDLAHPDPAGAIAPALRILRNRAPMLAVLVGARDDPQGLDKQRAVLKGAGATVFAGNAAAARAAAELVRPAS